MNLDDTKDLMARSGMRVIASTPQQFAEFLSREMVKYERVIKLARIKEE
jgi:tripartite-type tricarboxylate transporter receptor subunit TctC